VRERIQATWREYAELERRIWVMAGVRAVNTMGLSLAMAFLAVYLVDERGNSARLYGAIMLAANLVQSLTQGYAGELSDRFGRVRLMVRALGSRAVVMAGLGALIWIDAPLWALVPTMVVNATLRGFFEPVAYALVADVAPPAGRVAAYGLQRMGTNLGWAIGPAAGGLLAEVIPYGGVFFVAGAVLVWAALATGRVADPGHFAEPGADQVTVSLREALGEALRRADTTLLLVSTFLFALLHTQLFSTLSIYAVGGLDLSHAELGGVYAANGAAVLLFQVPAVALIARIGGSRALVLGALLYVAAFVAIGSALGPLTLAAAVLLLTAGEVICAPAQQAAAAELGDPRRMGRAFGLMGFAQMLGVAFAPLAGGTLYDHFRDRPHLMWGIPAGGAVVLAVSYTALGAVMARER